MSALPVTVRMRCMVKINSLSLTLFLQGMRNLSISCSLVSLIILGTSLVVFWIGLIEREVPPVLVVSVLYLLSGWLVGGPAVFWRVA